MSIEQSLERIAIALEKLASPMLTLTRPTPTANPFKEASVPVTVQAAAASSAAACSRDDIKAKLKALGVQFNEKLRTDSLLALLQQAEAGTLKQPAPEKEKPTTASFLDETPKPSPDPAPSFLSTEPVAPAQPPAKVYTLEETRENLRRFAAKFGEPPALAILAKFKLVQVGQAAASGCLQELAVEILRQEKERDAANGKQ